MLPALTTALKDGDTNTINQIFNQILTDQQTETTWHAIPVILLNHMTCVLCGAEPCQGSMRTRHISFN